MWPTDLDAEVAIRRERLVGAASPRRIPSPARWRRSFGVRLVRLGMVVAGSKAFDRPAPTVACR
jgi:hypothetical protein